MKKPISSKGKDQASASSDGKVSREDALKNLGFDVGGDINFASKKSALDLPAKLKQELTDLGLDCRFINLKKFKEYGFHANDWKPYAFQTRGREFPNMDSDGFYKKQDLILAVKPVEYTKAYREHLARKNDKLAGINKKQAEEFKRSLKDANISSVVTDGYDD